MSRMLHNIWAIGLCLIFAVSAAIAASNPPPASFSTLAGTASPAQMPAFYGNLSLDPTTPMTFVDTGQSNSINFGENGDTTIPQTGGGIWVWDDVQNKYVVAVYGVYPINNHPPGLSTWSPNIGIEFLKQLKLSGRIQDSRPLRLHIVSKSGRSVANWAAYKYDLNSVLTSPSAMVHALSQLTTAGVTQLDGIIYAQGENDSISTTPDLYTGNAFQDWGFGNNSTGLVSGPYSSAATVAAVTAAGGFNTYFGFLAGIQQALNNFLTLPGATSTTPVMVLELHEYSQSSEYSRNDAIHQLPTLMPNIGIVSTANTTASAIAGNQEHFDGPSINEIGRRELATFLGLYYNAKAITPLGPTGAPTTLGQALRITSNIDQAGISNSTDGTYYTVAPDQLRNSPTYLYAANSSLLLPLASNLGGSIDVDVECWTGTCTILSYQTLTGYPGGYTTVSETLPTGSTSLYSYTLPTGTRLTLNNGRGRWALKELPYNSGLLRGNLFNASANIGTNAATTFLSSVLVTSNVATLSYTVGGVTSTVSETFDGTVNTTSDLTMTALALDLQNALGSTYTVDAIASVNAITVMGPTQVTFNASSSTVTGGASQAIFGAMTGVYALSPRHMGEAWGAVANIAYVLPNSNSNNPGNVALVANGGGGTAGPISVDTWTNTLIDRSGQLISGTWGTNPLLIIATNGSCYFSPDLTSRWLEIGGTCLANPAGLGQGGQLGPNPYRLVLSAAMVTGNSIQISGTATPNGGSATAIATVTQPFISSSAITVALAAQALQNSMATVVTGATVSAVWGQNIFQINLPTGASMSLTGAITGGASQPTVTQDGGIYSFSATQVGKDWYAPTAASTLVLPSPNGPISQRIGINGQTTAVATTINLVSGSFINRTGQVVSTFQLRPGMTAILEATQVSRWEATGGSYLRWSEGQNIASPTTGSTVALTSGVANLAVYISGSNIAALTLTLPSSPLEGDRVEVESETAVTTLTLSGGTVISGPTALTAHSYFTLIYHTSGSRWTRNG